jgi:thiamine pyrophosphate-dependent acetolactate synthase large subunit-like protein
MAKEPPPRKTLEERLVVCDCSYEYGLKDFIESLNEAKVTFLEKYPQFTEDDIVVDISADGDEYSYHRNAYVSLIGKREETDEEYAKRLAYYAEVEARKEAEKAAKEAKKEEREKKQLERLKEKYEPKT